jgi:hypothetical protein
VGKTPPNREVWPAMSEQSESDGSALTTPFEKLFWIWTLKFLNLTIIKQVSFLLDEK